MAVSWRVAASLDVLLGQLNAAAPGRSKVADGSIGDAAHSARVSFHNPDKDGVVRARDFTHDPAHGLDGQRLADALVASRDPRLLEIIWNRKYWTPKGGWVPYTGANPHTKHVHVSVVGSGSLYDSPKKWLLPGLVPVKEEDIVASLDDLRRAIREEVGRVVWSEYRIAPRDQTGKMLPAMSPEMLLALTHTIPAATGDEVLGRMLPNAERPNKSAKTNLAAQVSWADAHVDSITDRLDKLERLIGDLVAALPKTERKA